MLCQRTICHESNGCRVVLEERLLTRHKATFNAPMGGDSLPLDLSSMRKGQVRINSQASKDTGVWAQLYKIAHLKAQAKAIAHAKAKKRPTGI
nr:beta-galactosidase 3-like [Tanacetum cinerariifolium]